jgi:HAD superfamily hydrolase (TIGR01490 family)
VTRLALFDLDNTLLPIDSDHAWGVFTTEIGWNDAAVFRRRNEDFYSQYKVGQLDLREYILFATEAIRRQGMARAHAAREEFMRRVIEPAIRDEAIALVGSHRSAGDMLAIVTATNDFVTRPIAERFGVADLIAVELEYDPSGLPTGRFIGMPSFREGKVARVEQWLALRGLGWDAIESSVFYSDSPNDLALLEKVSDPVATNPDRALRAIAIQRGWRILDLFAARSGTTAENP